MLSSGSSADLVADFALPVALETITDLLGLPEADRTDFYHWSRAFLSHSTLSPQEAEASLFAMYDHLSRLLRHRRETPVGDLLSQIAADGAGLPEHQQVMLPIALLLGGWETVASNIATFTQVLLSHPYGTYDSAWPYRPRPSPQDRSRRRRPHPAAGHLGLTPPIARVRAVPAQPYGQAVPSR
nr:hypothetical protein GCM10020093_060490 [Planobispora longispora]